MSPSLTLALLAAAGVALVVQNLVMVRITATVSSVLVPLVLNSAVGLILLLTALGVRQGTAGMREALGAVCPEALLPGALGTFFVLAALLGYQRIGAATTIAVLVAAQLIAGLLADVYAADAGFTPPGFAALAGALLLVAGAVLIARERL